MKVLERPDIQRGTVTSVEVAQVAGRYNFKGVATATGIVDRMRRVFLPGAFKSLMPQVPLLAFHYDDRPVGISKLTRKGDLILHDSSLANIVFAQELEELIKAGAIPATSIGWVSSEKYWGFSELEKGNPALVKVIEKAGIEKAEDIIYFAQAEILENSVTPVPANPLALISVASMLGSRERGTVEAMQELVKGQIFPVEVEVLAGASVALQKAHDSLVEAGAVCAETSTDPYSDPGIKGNWKKFIRSPYKSEDKTEEEVAEGESVHSFLLTIDSKLEEVYQAYSSSDHEALVEVVKSISETAAVWSTQYVNNLPDSAFAYIAPGGKKDSGGKTIPRALRYFPHHDSGGAPDEAHVRNALARIPQAKIPDSAKASATSHVQAHAKKLGIGQDSTEPTAEVEVQESELPVKMEEFDRELAELEAQI